MSDLDPFDSHVEFARQHLVAGYGLVEEREKSDEVREPAWRAYVDDSAGLLRRSLEEGLTGDIGPHLVPGEAEFVDENGDQRYAPLHESTPAADLERVAAHALVAHALLRREAEERMLIALVAMEMTKPDDQRRFRIVNGVRTIEVGDRVTVLPVEPCALCGEVLSVRTATVTQLPDDENRFEVALDDPYGIHLSGDGNGRCSSRVGLVRYRADELAPLDDNEDTPNGRKAATLLREESSDA